VGTSSSGTIRELIGWNEEIAGRTIVVVEDIVDTGNTIERIVSELLVRKAAEVRIAAMFLKPSVYTKDIGIDYVGFEIPNDFVIGYGLDYNGLGRNLPSVYTIVS
jgi:hypoxanthine phosphoribosyltransferase